MRPILKKPGKLKLKNMEKFQPKPALNPEPVISASQELKTKDKIIPEKQFPGAGVIVTSDRTVTGQGANFTKQIEQGDSIILKYPISKAQAEKTVSLVLGDNSLLIEQAFEEEIAVYQNYLIRKKAKVIKGEDLNEQYNERMKQIYKTKQIKKPTINVRVKKGTWSYENKQVEVDEKISKDQLLHIRQKMSQDKFCW